MKVGTDGVLLGAWFPMNEGCTVLDIGTGTGLVAIMAAQRGAGRVTAVDIDPDAAGQARANAANSPWAERIDVVCSDIALFNAGFRYDRIVCNPPYFADSLQSPDMQRTIARHTVSLSFRDLLAAVSRLLAEDGEFSVVIPFDCKARLESEAALAGLFKVRECAVKTTPRKQPRRYLIAFRRHPSDLELTEGVIEIKPSVRSEWYQELTKDFYL